MSITPAIKIYKNNYKIKLLLRSWITKDILKEILTCNSFHLQKLDMFIWFKNWFHITTVEFSIITHFVTVLRLYKQIKIMLYMYYTCIDFHFVVINLIIFNRSCIYMVFKNRKNLFIYFSHRFSFPSSNHSY